MPKERIADAYVQILPTTDGIKARLSSEMQTAGYSAGQAGGESAGTSFGKMALSRFASVFSVSALSAIAINGIKATYAAYSEYQQNVGGVETLFGKNADEVMAYAKEAYRTAGLSANQYMQQVTGFASSLLQSLGGNTKKAAKIANMAVIDMSDNANKFGTDIEAIQRAYQGFAKQNYTMLDNLKLGYGGTKTEMQRLLKDAEKLTGIHYDISNLDDVYNAIHAVQVEMGVTGTTSKEASETLSGSWASVKAAANNAMVAIASGEGIDEALDTLEDTICTWLENAMPVFARIVWGYAKTFAKYFTPGAQVLEPYMDELRELDAEYTKLGGSMEKGKVNTDLMEKAQKNLDKRITTIPEHLNKATQAMNSFSSVYNQHDFIGIGVNVTTGIADGMTSADGFNALFNASKKVKDYVASQLQGELKIHSPSKVMADMVGAFIPSGIAAGIEEHLDDLDSANMRTANEAVSGMARTGADYTPALADSIISGMGTLAAANNGNGQEVTLINYLYPNGPKMGQTTVNTYDTYKRRYG